MDETLIEALTQEMRADFQLPPYLADAVIGRSLKRCGAVLLALNPAADFESNAVGRGLVKDFAYYDINHRYEEFLANYQRDILSWQLGQEVGDGSD